MNKALEISRISGMEGDARLYKLNKPLAGNYYVIVSGVHNQYTTETYIFSSNKLGDIIDWGELDGSFKGAIDHKRALNNAGYEIISD